MFAIAGFLQADGTRWTGRTTGRSDETVGSALTSLDIGLPMDDIRPLIGNAFVDPDNPGETRVEAVDRRGRPASIRVTCTGFQPPGEGGVNGALMLMEVQA